MSKYVIVIRYHIDMLGFEVLWTYYTIKPSSPSLKPGCKVTISDARLANPVLSILRLDSDSILAVL